MEKLIRDIIAVADRTLLTADERKIGHYINLAIHYEPQLGFAQCSCDVWDEDTLVRIERKTLMDSHISIEDALKKQLKHLIGMEEIENDMSIENDHERLSHPFTQ